MLAKGAVGVDVLTGLGAVGRQLGRLRGAGPASQPSTLCDRCLTRGAGMLGNPLCDRCLTGGQEGRKALAGPAQLVQDALPGRRVQRRIGPGHQVPEHRDERRVLAGQLFRLRPGGVDEAHAVVGEVGRLDDPPPGRALQAVRDVFPVLLVLVPAGLPDGVGHGPDQLGHPRPEPVGQHRERGLPVATGSELRGVVFHRIVQQRGRRDVGVVHLVVREDPDRHAQQVVQVGLPLPPVAGVQCRRELQGLRQAPPLRVREGGDLRREPIPQPRFAIGRGDRVQRHGPQ